MEATPPSSLLEAVEAILGEGGGKAVLSLSTTYQWFQRRLVEKYGPALTQLFAEMAGVLAHLRAVQVAAGRARAVAEVAEQVVPHLPHCPDARSVANFVAAAEATLRKTAEAAESLGPDAPAALLALTQNPPLARLKALQEAAAAQGELLEFLGATKGRMEARLGELLQQQFYVNLVRAPSDAAFSNCQILGQRHAAVRAQYEAQLTEPRLLAASRLKARCELLVGQMNEALAEFLAVAAHYQAVYPYELEAEGVAELAHFLDLFPAAQAPNYDFYYAASAAQADALVACLAALPGANLTALPISKKKKQQLVEFSRRFDGPRWLGHFREWLAKAAEFAALDNEPAYQAEARAFRDLFVRFVASQKEYAAARAQHQRYTAIICRFLENFNSFRYDFSSFALDTFAQPAEVTMDHWHKPD